VSGLEDIRAAVLEVAANATRSLTILTQDLEPHVYDDAAFTDIVKHLCLTRSFAHVRVLVADPERAIRDGHRLVSLGRRLTSFVEFRVLSGDHRSRHPEAYLIADSTGLVYRADGSSWDGIADDYDPPTARVYLNEFEAVWNAGSGTPALRRLHI
jgi:hypothetical protein